MHFKKGDRVKVMLPSKEVTGVDTVKQFQGLESVIKDVSINYKLKSAYGYSYTLKGCKTDWGLPYWFCEDWLVPIDEGVAV